MLSDFCLSLAQGLGIKILMVLTFNLTRQHVPSPSGYRSSRRPRAAHSVYTEQIIQFFRVF